ncbi:MAG: hypothetical protein OXI53_12200 [Nitrospira sp.]|nr:hypothetical protein [Nitrospira sp.]
MDMKRFFLYAIVIAALALAGCGGNGGGDMAMNGDGNGDGNGNGNGTPMQCPEGQTGTYPNCMTSPSPPPACTLGGGGLECSAKVVAAPIADGNGDDSFDGLPAETAPTAANVTEALDSGRPNQPVTGGVFVAEGTRPLTVSQANKLTHTDGREFAMSASMPADLGTPWSGSIQTRSMPREGTMSGHDDRVTVYTDRRASTNQDYDEYFTSTTISANTNGAGDAVSAVADGTGALTLESVAGHHALFMAAAFPSGINQTFNYVDDEPSTENVDETKQPGNSPRMFDGIFRGVPGKFACTGGCTAVTNGKGELTTLAGTWTFTPTGRPGDIFGYWVRATTDRDGMTTHGISTFTGGTLFPVSATDGSTAISDLVGSATYTGKATGLYVLKTYSSEANDFTVDSSGQFVADATLTANFGGTEFGDDSNFEVDGMINGFKNMDGDSIDDNWEVTLNDAMFGEGDANTFVGTTVTDRSGVNPGVWRGGFYGVPRNRDGVVVTADNPSTPVDDRAPTGIAGEFNAHFNTGGQNPGHVIGALGARR